MHQLDPDFPIYRVGVRTIYVRTARRPFLFTNQTNKTNITN